MLNGINMTEKQNLIQTEIERLVAHMARVYAVTQDEVWNELYIRSLKEETINRRK